MPVAHLRAAACQLIGIEDQLSGALQGFGTKGREQAAPTHAIEQRLAEFFFQGPDAAAQCRLRDEQRFG